MGFVLVRDATTDDYERLLATAETFVQKYGNGYDASEWQIIQNSLADGATHKHHISRDAQLLVDWLCQRVRDERYDNSLAHIWTKRARRALRGDGDEIAWNAVGYSTGRGS
mgnify:CR=1 FL=1